MVGMRIIPHACNHIHIIINKEYYLDLYTDCSLGTRIMKKRRDTNTMISETIIE